MSKRDTLDDVHPSANVGAVQYHTEPIMNPAFCAEPEGRRGCGVVRVTLESDGKLYIEQDHTSNRVSLDVAIQALQRRHREIEEEMRERLRAEEERTRSLREEFESVLDEAADVFDVEIE